MLWILLLVGGIGAFIMFVLIVAEFFLSSIEWHDIREFAIKMVIFIGIGAVGFFGLAGIDALSYEEVSKTADWELQSLSDNSQISGKGAGTLFYVYVSIDTNEVYSFYYKQDDGGFKRGKVEADKTTIYEINCTPHVVEYTTYTKNKMNNFLRAILAFGYGESNQQTYEIYTPKGTILKTFNLDSQ